MNIIATIRAYVDRIVTGDGKCTGMKALLLDASTTQIVSSVYSQSDILSKEVYLVTRLDEDNITKKNIYCSNENTKTSHLQAVAYLRPTNKNIDFLIKHLKCPRFCEYNIFFSGILSSGHLRYIAENDEHEIIKQIQEFYGDFLPVNEDLISLNCRGTLSMTSSIGTSWERDHIDLYERTKQGLCGLLLSLKKQPVQIRYSANSACANKLAVDVHDMILHDQIFHFRKMSNRGGCLLLILDRMDDPVTPLLSQWTYQAMIHELLGLNNSRVVLKDAPNISKDLEEIVLSREQDDFFKTHLYTNFGDLGEAIQKLLKDYKLTAESHNINKLSSIESMQNFVEKFPELRRDGHVVSKHVVLMGELARLVEVCSLMEISQFEQVLACIDDQTLHWKELITKLTDVNVKIPDKLRLALLYILRYEHVTNLYHIKAEMKNGGVPDDMIDLISSMLRYAGCKVRGPGLYGIGLNQDIVSKVTNSFKTNVKGISNIYSQHEPVLMNIIQNISKGKLQQKTHPYMSNDLRKCGSFSPEKDIPDEIIVFMVGGVTYEEATKVNDFNKTNDKHISVLLGGTTIHNSTSFLEELKRL